MGRAACCDKNGVKKGPWTPEEDQKLVDYIHTHGSGNWRTLPNNAGLQRCGKSCRLRWTNYLRPDIKRGKFSFQEEQTIIHLHSLLGNKWSAIACRLPGRTDNEIKNYWNTHIRKCLLRMGIDPVTHSPRLDLLDISSLLNQTLYNHQFTDDPNSQFRVPRFLGFEPMINPEILNLATSVFPGPTQPEPTTAQSQDPNQNQNLIQHEIRQHQDQLVCDQEQTLVPRSSENLLQLHDYDSFMNVGFNDQDGHLPSLLNLDLINQHNYVACSNDNDQSIMGSMFSGEQSPSPFSNSNSTYIGNQDERERYCRNMIKFAFPADLLDATQYL